MKNKEIIEMIDQEFEDFEQDRNRRKNIKDILSFKNSAFEYSEKNIIMNEPKYKKKLNTSIYIKTMNTNKNQLF